ncbi:CotH protein [Pseudobythopirellula maris]|uniref:CotH protein n=1 Tax=Pseudobythopirellula maris TaxID=2527991 RepID=A0A5C5ZNI3_9BACT|nr:CotH kinase family protein [Pseudobythopirellula maris]TWT89009.1 CotH protein [Pseudobythopirellula maris]
MKRLVYALTFTVLLLAAYRAHTQPPRDGRVGPPGGEEIELLDDFDADGDGVLGASERRAARLWLGDPQQQRGGRRGFGPPGGFRGRNNREAPSPGARLRPDGVPHYPDAPLYDPDVLRTLFLDFEHDGEPNAWQEELADFKGTDVDVPATLTVDGVAYPGVGVHFRGASSYMMVPDGYKKSLNVSLDHTDEDQRLGGYKTLNLLNCNGDPSMMSAALYAEIARDRVAVPKVNFVEVVVGGESWGVFANVQQFDKIFLRENYGSSKGTRWKVPGSPRGDGGLRYLGEGLAPYESRFEMKSNDGEKAWRALIELCRVLNETPRDRLEQELGPLLDIDEALRFLALDVALVNSDGYWTRASDYNLFRDAEGQFHLIPHDTNEALRASHGPPGGGPGGPGGFGPPAGFGPPPGFGPPEGFGPPPNGAADGPPEQEGRRRGRRGGGERGGFGPHGGVDLDPLVVVDEERMPLRSRLLAVPSLREKYLGYVQEIARDALDWDHLGPRVEHYRELIRPAVERDTRKLTTTEAFLAATSPARDAEDSLRAFAEGRRRYLLEYKPPAP